MAQAARNKGFLGALFDFSFSEFVTTKIIRLLYVLAIAISVVIGIALVISGFAIGFGRGVLMLIAAPVVVLLYIIGARIWLELVIVVFRIGEHVRDIANRGATPSAPPASTDPDPFV